MWILYLIIAYFLFRWIKPKHPKKELNIYFGVPGSGKTTYAAWLTRRSFKQSKIVDWAEKYRYFYHWWLRSIIANIIFDRGLFKHRYPVYSNTPITGAYELDAKKDIGFYMIDNGRVIIDEAGIEYNNRKFKTFSEEAIYWYKYFRHYQCSVDVFSQSYEDMDITLRRLAQHYFVVKKSVWPKCIVVKRIRRKVGIDDQTHQIIDQFYFGFPIIDSQWVFTPPLWQYFNSFSRKELPKKEWKKW